MYESWCGEGTDQPDVLMDQTGFPRLVRRCVVACGLPLCANGLSVQQAPGLSGWLRDREEWTKVPFGNPPRPLRNWDTVAPMLQPHFPGGGGAGTTSTT